MNKLPVKKYNDTKKMKEHFSNNNDKVSWEKFRKICFKITVRFKI